jgi:hypothetical protein
MYWTGDCMICIVNQIFSYIYSILMTGCQLRRLIHPWVSLTIIILRGDHDEKAFYISFLFFFIFDIRNNLSIRYAQLNLI